ITAHKEGYQNIITNITVTPPLSESKRLIITPEKYTIDADKQFTVMVFDETGLPIQGATVGIQNSVEKGTITTTNNDGRAVLIAPNKETMIIIAQKNGYIDGQETLWVNTDQGFLSSLLNNQYRTILIAVFILIFVIVFVTLRNQRESAYHPKSTSPFQNNVPIVNNIDSSQEKQQQMRTRTRDPKIEEIRITRKNPEKTIVSIARTPQLSKNYDQHQKKNIHKWFEGNKNIEHTVDSLTQSIDKAKENKWHEGSEDIRKKIDRALEKTNE
ncbi:MAG: carboxypeptidase regulatory-like domain-containing protein, partial [Candidatus Heimdallarchaeota archaeon]|nr:carboxypeptidase regulatory-like domain-containing protein [Candidatus Heimdallarchaeota archaeon]